MSNFQNYSIKGKSYIEAEGVGADRYITAYEYIIKNRTSFNIENGFQLLKKVALNDDNCKTLCSMVFMPEKNEIYFSLNQDYKKIWKVFLTDNKIQTYVGFKKNKTYNFPENGILANHL